MQTYVLGFGFTPAREYVLLVRKEKGPPINIGKWNGIGGKIEPNETAYEAMVREFLEETNLEAEWSQFGYMEGFDWRVELFHGVIKNPRNQKGKNDVGELLSWHGIFEVLNPSRSGIYAWNVPVLVVHAIAGKGQLKITE